MSYNTAARIIGKKWTIRILQELTRAQDQGLRYYELQESLKSISPKVLAERLKELEKEGLISRYVNIFEKPPSVSYELTNSGWELQDIIEGLQSWGQKNKSLEKQSLLTNDERNRNLFERVRFLAFLIENSSQALCVFSPKGHIMTWNRAFCELVGYSEEELQSLKSIEQLTPPEWRESEEKVLKGLHSKEEPQRYKKEFFRMDQSRIPVEILIHQVCDAKGDVQYYYSFITDITERKRAEERIQYQHDTFLNHIIESIPNPFYIIDTNDYRITMANTSANLDLQSENSTCFALTHGRNKPCEGEDHLCPLEEAKRTKQQVVVEHIHHDKDGSELIFEVHGYPIFDCEGNVQQIIGYNLDVTERKQAEKALKESEEKYYNFFEHASDSIFITDQKTRLFLDVNENAVKQLGYTKDELLQLTVEDVFLPLDENQRKINRKQLQESSSVIFERVQLHKDGTGLPVEVSTRIIEYGGQQVLQSFARDISERKKAEESLQLAHEELEGRVKERTEELNLINEQLKLEIAERHWAETLLKIEKNYLEKLHDTLGNVIITVKLPEREIEYVNSSVEVIFGYKPEECIGKSTSGLYADEEGFQEFGRALSKAIEQGQDVLHSENILKRKNGDLFPAGITTSFLKEGDKVVKVISIIHDITDLKRTEEAL